MFTAPLFDVRPIQFALLNRQYIFDISTVLFTKPTDLHNDDIFRPRNKCLPAQKFHRDPSLETCLVNWSSDNRNNSTVNGVPEKRISCLNVPVLVSNFNCGSV